MTARGKLRAGAALFAVLLGLEAWAAYRLLAPRPRDLEAFPITWERQELVLAAAPPPGEAFLQQEGRTDLNLDVEAIRARLSAESLRSLRQMGHEPPAAWGKIRFFSPPSSAARAPACPMNLAIAGVEGPITLRLAPSGTADDRQRSLTLTAEGTDLLAELQPLASPESPGSSGIGCQRRLNASGQEIEFPAGLSLRLRIARSAPLTLIFSSPGPLAARPVSLFDLSKLSLQSLRLGSRDRPAAEPRIAISSSDGKPSFRLTSFRIAGEAIRITVDGSGFVSGRDAPFSWEWPPLSLFVLGLLAAHVRLTAWLVRARFRRKSRASRPLVFISYSHIDEEWKDRLVKHLGVIAAEGEIEIWDDRQIRAGEEWLAAIDAALQRASVAVLLVSADFLTSPFIRSREVPSLLARRRTGLRVIPLIVRPSAWEAVEWLAALQCRPRDGRPLSQSRKHKAEESLAELAIEIRDLLRSSPPQEEQA